MFDGAFYFDHPYYYQTFKRAGYTKSDICALVDFLNTKMTKKEVSAFMRRLTDSEQIKARLFSDPEFCDDADNVSLLEMYLEDYRLNRNSAKELAEDERKELLFNEVKQIFVSELDYFDGRGEKIFDYWLQRGYNQLDTANYFNIPILSFRYRIERIKRTLNERYGVGKITFKATKMFIDPERLKKSLVRFILHSSPSKHRLRETAIIDQFGKQAYSIIQELVKEGIVKTDLTYVYVLKELDDQKADE